MFEYQREQILMGLLLSFFRNILLLYLVVAIFILWLRNRGKRKDGYAQYMDVDGNAMKGYGPAIEDISKKRKIVRILVKSFISLLLVSLSVAFIHFNFRNSLLLYSLGKLWGYTIFFAILILFARCYKKSIAGSYSIYLSENYIMGEYGFRMGPQINRSEVLNIEESIIQLEVITRDKQISLTIPRDIDGYDEIKSKLLEWSKLNCSA